MPEIPPANPPASTSRLVYLDLFRGLAVFAMFDAHITEALVKLPPGAGRLHHWHNLSFNLPAPGFLFAAGLSFGMAAYARWDQFSGWTAALRSRLTRILEVLFIAYLLHVPATSLSATLAAPEFAQRRFLGWDILQCIGYTLLLLLVVALLLPRREWFLRAAVALTLLIAFASAWLWDMSWDVPWVASGSSEPLPLGLPWWIATIFSKQLGSNFPFFPYAVFLTAGAVWGYLFAQARAVGGDHLFLQRSLWAGLALLAGCLVLTQVPLPAPYNDFWGGSPVFIFLRVGLLAAMLAGLYFIEAMLAPAMGFIITLGKESLIVYFVHLLIVYGSPLNQGWNMKAMFSGGIGFWTWLGLLASLTAAMTALAWCWTRLKSHWGESLDRALWAVAGLAILGFVIR